MATKPKRESDRQAVVQRLIEEAVLHYEENIEPAQKTAVDYYHSRPYGDERDDRSRVVTSEVRDTMRQMMPSLLRIFFGPRKAAEFIPDSMEDVAAAEQATHTVNYVFRSMNPGFTITHDAIKNALRERIGVFKWWHEEAYCRKGARMTGLTEEQLTALAAEEGVEVNVRGRHEDGTVEAEITRVDMQHRYRVMAVPPEEFGYSPDARDLESAGVVFHRREMPVGELIAMGLDREFVESKIGRDERDTDGLRRSRSMSETDDAEIREEPDPSMQPVIYTEAYARVADEKGIPELRMFQCVGDDYEINPENLDGDLVDELPFAVLPAPDPEPHTLSGMSVADDVGPLQRWSSQILRGTFDSLSQTIHPKAAVLEGEVNIGDLESGAASNYVRVSKIGAIEWLSQPWVGGDTLPMLEFIRTQREERSGMSRASNGLDADAMQSTTKAAVAATLSASQARLEMIARIFAETGFTRLMKGLLKLLVKHQDRPMMIRLNNKYVEVDPRYWQADMDVHVNVALGQGTPEDQVQALASVVGLQREMQSMGSPLVSNVEVRKALDRTIEFGQLGLPEDFFKPWGVEEEAQYQQAQAQQPPPPDAQMALVEVEKQAAQAKAQLDMQKFQMELQFKQQELALRQREMELQDDRERDRWSQEFALKEKELELKYAAQQLEAELDARAQRARVEMDVEVAREKAHLDAEVKREAIKAKPAPGGDK